MEPIDWMLRIIFFSLFQKRRRREQKIFLNNLKFGTTFVKPFDNQKIISKIIYEIKSINKTTIERVQNMQLLHSLF
jgi:hypothetical protein